MILNKVHLLVLVVLLIVLQAISLDAYNRKGDKDDVDSVEDNVIVTGKYNPASNDRSQALANRRDRYSPYGSSANNYRARSRWSSPPPPPPPPPSSSLYDDQSDYNDRSPYGYGPSNSLSNYPGGYSSGGYDSGPNCHSLLDSVYPVFADICGSVPQARYSLPNAFGHVERWQIAQTLSILLGPATPSSANPACGRSLRLLICPLLFPPCPSRYEAPPVLPCQPFCRAVKAQCAAPTLELLPCDFLPIATELCPVNPTPYSSLLASFMSPSPMNGPLPPFGLPQSPLSSLLAQSAFAAGLSPFDMPPPGFPLSPFPPQMPPPGFQLSPFSQQMPPPGFQFSPSSPPPGFQFSPSSPPPGAPPSPPPPAMTPPNGLPPGLASLLASSGMPPGAFPSFLSASGMPPGQFSPGQFSPGQFSPGQFSPAQMGPSLTPINPYLTPEPYMGDNFTPILVDFPPLQYMPGFQQTSRYYPLTRSATEKV